MPLIGGAHELRRVARLLCGAAGLDPDQICELRLDDYDGHGRVKLMRWQTWEAIQRATMALAVEQ